jgi:hypothetical protein
VTRIAASSVGDGTVVRARLRSITTASFATLLRYAYVSWSERAFAAETMFPFCS